MVNDILMEACQPDGWTMRPGKDHTVVVVPVGGDRHQEVLVTTSTEDGETTIRFHTVIGPVEDLTGRRPTAALRLNFGLVSCAFAVSGDDLVLVRTQGAARIDAEEARATIRQLAETGDRYEKHLYGTDVH